MDQNFRVTEAVKSGKVQVPDEIRQMIEFYETMELPERKVNPEATVWPDLAKVWLDKYLK